MINFYDINWIFSHGKSSKKKSLNQYTNSVINSATVQDEIKKQIKFRQENQEIKYQFTHDLNFSKKITDSVNQDAKQICLQMMSTYNFNTIRLMGYVFRKYFNQIYEKIEFDRQKLRNIRSLYQTNTKNPIIFLPTHKSYIDFTLLNYVLYMEDLRHPYIAAADDFLNIKGVNKILRSAGAFYIKRKSANDSFYNSIFKEYVQQLILDEVALEFFIEGTRSRNGKLVNAKLGLLEIICQLFFENKVSDIYFIPITINYDKVLEAETFPYELLGEEKVKESLTRVLKSILLVFRNFGQVHLGFGNIISIKEFRMKILQSQRINLQNNLTIVKKLGKVIIKEFTQNLVIMPVHILSTILLINRDGITFEQLLNNVEILITELNRRKANIGRSQNQSYNTTQFALSIQQQGLKLLDNILIQKKQSIFVINIIPKKDYKNLMLLSYYRNNLHHIFIQNAICLISLEYLVSLNKDKYVNIEQLIQQMISLNDIFQFELIEFQKLSKTKNCIRIITELSQLKIIKISQEEMIQNIQTAQSQYLSQIICSFLFYIAECYWITSLFFIFLINEKKQIQNDKIISKIQFLADSLVQLKNYLYFSIMKKFSEKYILNYECCSQDCIKNALKFFYVKLLFNNFIIKNQKKELIFNESKNKIEFVKVNLSKQQELKKIQQYLKGLVQLQNKCSNFKNLFISKL